MATASEGQEKLFPIFTRMSDNFEKNLHIGKLIFSRFEKLTHVDVGFKLSDRAEMAAVWRF